MKWLNFLILFASNTILAASSIAPGQISLDFTNIKTRDLLQLLAKYSGKNLIISDKVKGRVSLNLHNTSWHEALAAVLKIRGLIKQESDNTIIITLPEEVDKKETLLAKPSVFNLHHTSAEDFSKVLGSAGILSLNGKVGFENRTNSVIVADTQDKIDTIKNIIRQIDIPTKQVLIEARIVSADENFARALGLEFSGVPVGEKDKPDTNSHVNNRENNTFNFAIAKLNHGSLLDVKLAALENEGRGRVISRPKLLTLDRQAAYIESGSEIPYQEKTKEGDTSTSFKKAVLSLKVTPEIVSKTGVNLLLQLNQDKVSQLTFNGVPAIDTRKIQTQVLVQNGETIVLGGIYEWAKTKHLERVPILGKIPLLGLLFQKQEAKTERKELLMFVTPRFVE